MSYLIYSKKIWSKNNLKVLKKKIKVNKKINYQEIKKSKPKIIFFIHWSQIIPEKIYKENLCIQFHSSNLPHFKGGSPIQNQIIQGIKKTKISAFKVERKLDAGKVCIKRDLSLSGSAEDIFIEMEKKSFQMINHLILRKNIKFYKQKGSGSFFPRRKPYHSNLQLIKNPNLKDIYNFIRMLDADGYPNAFINFNGFKILLKQVRSDKNILNGKFEVIKKK
jgi:methionyl-tRNA formyltransferase